MEQNSSLKKDVAIAERKLIARNERIQNLEALLQDAQEKLNVQNAKFEVRLQTVRDRLDQARGSLAPLADRLQWLILPVSSPSQRSRVAGKATASTLAGSPSPSEVVLPS